MLVSPYAEMANGQVNVGSRLLPENIEKAFRSYLIAHPTIDFSNGITWQYSDFFGR